MARSKPETVELGSSFEPEYVAGGQVDHNFYTCVL